MTAPSPQVYRAPMDNPVHVSNEQNIHTPPASDMSSHGMKGDDDDDDAAASSSDLSDLDDQFEGEAQSTPVVEPDRYEGGIPIFQPTMDQFRDFEKYMDAVNPYGMKSGIVLIDPPPQWKAERKALDDMVKAIKVRNPITQEFHHNEYGIYTQRNMEKMRTYNLPQWKALCEQSQYQPPARRGERRNKGGAGPGSKIVPLKRKSQPLPLPEGVRRKAGRPRVKPAKEDNVDEERNVVAPPTPTSPDQGLDTPVKDEVIEMADSTPTKRPGKPARKRAQPKLGSQPKRATKKTSEKAGGEKATTVAARRLHNAADAVAGDFNEEDFQDFDYRTHSHDEWTKERCEELEEKYWKSLSYTNPMYGADMPGSLFDNDTKCWNVAKLPNLLDILGSKIPGVNTAYLYLGMWRATFAWHLEDVDLYSINYIHFGAPKQWYSISQADAPKFEKAMRSIYAHEAKNCSQFLRHKTFLVSPSLLKNKYGVTVNRVVHREGQFVVTFPIGYHSGYNLGYNCAESVNFALESWLPYGKVAKKCQCEDDSVFIDVDWFVRRLNGDPTPEVEEWVEVTDDEDGAGVPTDLPTPPGSDRGQFKLGKRKRPPAKAGSGKRTKKIKIKISRSAVPCCLCPNDFACDELLPTEDKRRAHRRCALYTPETYFDEIDSKEVIRGMAEISKARLDLRCNECRQKRGSCFQCSSAKCTRAYHATCAAQAGVQVDIGEVAIWHEGAEYRDIGLDFRCKLHRSVKTAKQSSDLARDNYRHIEKDTKEFHAYLTGLKANDIVQFQSSSSDDIEAGVLVEPLNEDEGILILDLLPTRQRRFIESNTVLFVNAATSCLEKPSANAKDFPEHLRGKAMSWEDTTNRKPSRLDPFCSGPDQSVAYRWEEFNSATPAANGNQKAVDLSNGRCLWYYLGSQSTESKAYYTGNPSQPVHDAASNFLQSVEPARRPLPAQPHQGRRPSLPASYPGQYSANANAPASSIAAATTSRSSMQDHLRPQSQNDYARRMAMIANSGTPISPIQYSDRPLPGSAYQNQANNIRTRMPTESAAGRGSLLEKSRAPCQPSPAHGAVSAGRPTIQPECEARPSVSPRKIGIDAQSVGRQRDFQRQGYQQSLSSAQLSPHSPGLHSGLGRNLLSLPPGHLSGPKQGSGPVAAERVANVVQHANTSAMAKKEASSALPGPYSPQISSPSVAQPNNKPAADRSTSSHQPSAQIDFSGHPHTLSELSHPQALRSSTQPASPTVPTPNLSMSSPVRSAPIDIPQPRRPTLAHIHDQGQPMAKPADLSPMETKRGYGTASAPISRPISAFQDMSVEASHCMPPPPVPRRASHPSVTLADEAGQTQDAKGSLVKEQGKANLARSKEEYRPGSTDKPIFSQETSTENRSSAMLSDVNGKEDGVQSKSLPANGNGNGNGNGPVSPRSASQARAKTPSPTAHVHSGSYPGAVVEAGALSSGRSVQVNKTALSRIIEEDDAADATSAKTPAAVLATQNAGDWVDVQQLFTQEAAVAAAAGDSDAGDAGDAELDKDWVQIGRANARAAPGADIASPGLGTGIAGSPDAGNKQLSDSFYTARSDDEKKLIDDEKEKMAVGGSLTSKG